MVSNILLSSDLFETYIIIFSVLSHASLAPHPDARKDSHNHIMHWNINTQTDLNATSR